VHDKYCVVPGAPDDIAVDKEGSVIKSAKTGQPLVDEGPDSFGQLSVLSGIPSPSESGIVVILKDDEDDITLLLRFES